MVAVRRLAAARKVVPVMVLRRQLALPLFFVSSLIWAQPPEAPVNRDAPVSPVPFERILRANQEPQNWLTYSGSTLSQRHSALTQITPANAKDLTLKWVFQSRSLDKHEVTPLVVDGVMYTVQGINDVIALDAATGKTIWTYRTSRMPALTIAADRKRAGWRFWATSCSWRRSIPT